MRIRKHLPALRLVNMNGLQYIKTGAAKLASNQVLQPSLISLEGILYSCKRSIHPELAGIFPVMYVCFNPAESNPDSQRINRVVANARFKIIKMPIAAQGKP